MKSGHSFWNTLYIFYSVNVQDLKKKLNLQFVVNYYRELHFGTKDSERSDLTVHRDNTRIASTRNKLNLLTPNDPYMGRTAPLTSKRCNLYIYSTNIGTEYFKHALHSPFFFSSKCSLFHNANLFGSCIIHILYTGCAKIKKIIPAPNG